LSVGTYAYNCTVYDTSGRKVSSIVQVTVLPLAPTIDQPSNIIYSIGQTGNSITWHPSSQIPDHWTISVNGSSPESYSWNGQAVTYNVDGWSVGTYSVNCTVGDTQGRSVSSTVTVTVQPSPAGEGIVVIAVAGAVGWVVVLALAVAMVVMRKGKK
jgi:hypothetical protein